MLRAPYSLRATTFDNVVPRFNDTSLPPLAGTSFATNILPLTCSPLSYRRYAEYPFNMGTSKRDIDEEDDCFITDVQLAKRARTSEPERRVRAPEATDALGKQPLQQQEMPSNYGDVPGPSYESQYEEGPKKSSEKPKDEEKRLKRWRKKAPQAWLDVRDRALTQRMFVLDRTRIDSRPEHPIETISLAGTTGNVYSITIDKVPTCDCPHARKGNQCKHIVYMLSRVLRVKRKELEYQLAFISSELKEIFEHAPPLPSTTAEESEKDGNRKPIEGECPICVVDFEPDSGEKILYCKASCGNNIHADCFNMWKATKPAGRVTCPFCRSPWQDDAAGLKGLAGGGNGQVNEEGYINVAGQLGLSGRRDYSTYNSYWVRQQVRRGEIGWGDDGAMEHDY